MESPRTERLEDARISRDDEYYEPRDQDRDTTMADQPPLASTSQVNGSSTAATPAQVATESAGPDSSAAASITPSVPAVPQSDAPTAPALTIPTPAIIQDEDVVMGSAS